MASSVMLSAVFAAVLVTCVMAQGYKPGQCPPGLEIYNATSPNCPNATCTIDQDCAGEKLCCPNGCSSTCVDPEADVISRNLPKTSVLVCEGGSDYLTCPNGKTIVVTGVFWGRGDKETCTSNPDDVLVSLECSGYYAYDYVRNICDGREECYVPASVGFFGDPCSNQTVKYLKMDYYCEDKTYHAQMCQWSYKLPLVCPDNKRIVPKYAFFGRADKTTCFMENMSDLTNCSADTATDVFRETCEGKERCMLDAWTGFFGDPCPGTYKYLDLDYSCADCVNEYGDDAMCDMWYMEGQCQENREWMMTNCRKSCWKCDPEPPVCQNIYFNDTACDLWVQQGNCYSDAAWMHTFCRRSCTGCDSKTGCGVDPYDRDYVDDKLCPGWYTEGQCNSNVHFMFSQCTKSCFGCNTDNVIRCENKYFENWRCEQWASQGECQYNPGFMIPNCLQSCLGCSEDPKCENSWGDRLCDYWEENGECDRNFVFMHQNCWKSCMKCAAPPACVNLGNDGQCERWAKAGECEKNPDFMLTECTKSCTKCGPVTSVDPECINAGGNNTICDQWADAGECARNPLFMIPNCYASCTLCYVQNQLRKIGPDPRPGQATDIPGAMTFILPYEFPETAYLTHFLAFFLRPDPIYLQVWRRYENGTWFLWNSGKVTPSRDAYNMAQTLPVNACIRVEAGDRIGFTSFNGRAHPVAQNPVDPNDVFTTTAYRRASSVGAFVEVLYPYEFSFSAAYANSNPAC